MTTGPARCLYALRPADRPGCQLTATVAYGTTCLCTPCNERRSTLGKGQAGRQLPAVDLDPLDLLVDAYTHPTHNGHRTVDVGRHPRPTTRCHLGRHSPRARHHQTSRPAALHPALTSIGASNGVRDGAGHRLPATQGPMCHKPIGYR